MDGNLDPTKLAPLWVQSLVPAGFSLFCPNFNKTFLTLFTLFIDVTFGHF